MQRLRGDDVSVITRLDRLGRSMLRFTTDLSRLVDAGAVRLLQIRIDARSRRFHSPVVLVVGMRRIRRDQRCGNGHENASASAFLWVGRVRWIHGRGAPSFVVFLRRSVVAESERDSGRCPSLWVTPCARFPREGRRIAHGRRRRIGARG
ncbi:hypothetical protein [Rhodococcus opacus]|uniref:hypothetical protein n=1 Tax=Rhodococcus opacus TaxID=37919 RepID=UPI00294A7C7D|nr:hypothetical protein [Rhodococcus opacus]MDV6247996.1 hypothetical protein [Rhodococcus opacus]